MTPRVSVVALAYNHGAYVEHALDSVAAQTFGDWELVVADDASGDDSAALIEGWLARHDVPATFVRHDRNRGVCATLNEALARVRGEYVSTLACDDAWLPEKLARQVALLDAAPATTGAVYSDAYLMGPSGEALDGMFVASYADFAEPPRGDLYGRLLRGNFIPGMATTIRRRCVEDVGGFDERLVFEDWDFWLRLARRYAIAYSPYVSARYRILTTSLMRTVGDRVDDAYRRIYLANYRHAGAERPFVRREIARLSALLAERHPERARAIAWDRVRHAPDTGAVRALVRSLAGPPKRS